MVCCRGSHEQRCLDESHQMRTECSYRDGTVGLLAYHICIDKHYMDFHGVMTEIQMSVAKIVIQSDSLIAPAIV